MKRQTARRIGFLSTRFGGTDGASWETEKCAAIVNAYSILGAGSKRVRLNVSAKFDLALLA